MIIRTCAVVTLIAMANMLFSGCTKTITRTLQSTGEYTSLRIIGVTLLTGEEIKFGDPSGRYHQSTGLVTGLMVNGERFHRKLNELKSVTVIDLSAEEPLPAVIEADDFGKSHKTQETKKIAAVVTHDGRQVEFNHAGGRIDPRNRVVIGRARDGSPVSIAFDDVKYVKVKKTNTTVTLILTALTVLTIISIVTFDPLKDFELGSNSSNN